MDEEIKEEGEQDTENEYFDSGDIEQIKNEGGLPEVKFPFGMFLFAIVKDVLDFFTAGFLGPFFSACFYIIFGMNTYQKAPLIKKGLEKRYFKRLTVLRLVEFIPFIDALPLTTISVYDMYREEKKIAEKAKELLEN